jgi:hypothetical protein
MHVVDVLRTFKERIGVVLLTRDARATFGSDHRHAGADFVLRKSELDGYALRAAVEMAVAARCGDLSEDAPSGARLPGDLQRIARDFLDSEAAFLAASADRDYRLAMAAKMAISRGDEQALDEMASMLGFSRATLRTYAIFARLDEPTIRELFLGRKNADGKPLSARHARALARLPPAARARWKERAFTESLTAEELERGIALQRRQ